MPVMNQTEQIQELAWKGSYDLILLNLLKLSNHGEQILMSRNYQVQKLVQRYYINDEFNPFYQSSKLH